MILHIKVYIDKNHISHSYIYTYYVGFISICNGIIGADAIGLPVLFTDFVKVIGSGGTSSYLGGD